jgi:hypothetical protein
MSELLNEEPLNHFALSRRLKAGYSTVHGRVMALKQQGILEGRADVPGTKNKQPTTLWGLSPLGLWAAAHVPDTIPKNCSKKDREKIDKQNKWIRAKSLDKCRAIILENWKRFTDTYELDKVKMKQPSYRFFTEWLESDKGTLDFLDTFGAWPLAGRAAALETFRRMMDLALIRLHGAWMPTLPAYGVEQYGGEWLRSLDPQNPYQALAEIASKHEKFHKLDAIMQEVDSPLHLYLEKTAREELVEKLSVVLGQTIARKLAVTPFFKDQGPLSIGVSSLNLNLLSPDALFDYGSSIWIKSKGVTIQTDDLNRIRINPEWTEYCDLEVPDHRTGEFMRIPARRSIR